MFFMVNSISGALNIEARKINVTERQFCCLNKSNFKKKLSF